MKTEKESVQGTGETFTFIDKLNNFQCTVKAEFLKKVKDPASLPMVDLMSNHEMSHYLHNPHGPAMLILHNGYEDFWLDGKKCTPEVAEKIKHNVKFKDELENILDT